MYLPQRKEVEAIVQQNKTLIIACLLLFLVALAGSWMVYRHYDRQAASDNHDVSRTVQSIEDDNQRARENVSTATEQIRQAGQQLDSLAESIDASERTVNDNKAVIDDSRQLIESSQRRLEQAESILREIDRANQLHD